MSNFFLRAPAVPPKNRLRWPDLGPPPHRPPGLGGGTCHKQALAMQSFGVLLVKVLATKKKFFRNVYTRKLIQRKKKRVLLFPESVMKGQIKQQGCTISASIATEWLLNPTAGCEPFQNKKENGHWLCYRCSLLLRQVAIIVEMVAIVVETGGHSLWDKGPLIWGAGVINSGDPPLQCGKIIQNYFRRCADNGFFSAGDGEIFFA